jgi:hypothetical protein
MLRSKIVLLIIMIAGFIILAMPDDDVRLFSISKKHGPSLLDAIGLLVMLCPYIYLATLAWKNRGRFKKYQGLNIVKIGVFIFAVGLGLVVTAVINDYPFWWIYVAIILIVLQVPVFYITLK